MRIFLFSFLFILSTFLSFSQSPKPGSGVLFPDPEKLTKPEVEISGELRTWHKLTLTLDGPHASEYGQSVFIFNSETGELDLDVRPEAGPKGRLGYMHPNPFLDFRMTVTFSHESGNPVYKVPGTLPAMAMPLKPGRNQAINGEPTFPRIKRAVGIIIFHLQQGGCGY
jgi:hypothetical protein